MKKLFLLALIPLLAACGEFAADKPKVPEVKPTIRLTLLPQDTLAQGKNVTILAKLNDIEQRTVLTDGELDTAHTEKFHLLLIDPTFTDYQHIHPQPTATPGIYSFQFTPKLGTSYRAWADVTPAATHKQEYVLTQLGEHSAPKVEKMESHEANIAGYHFSLAFDKSPVAGQESMGTIRITDKNGNPVAALEPVMGAFAHIVAFHQDYHTVLHTHPMGPEPTNANARGGPELTFHFEPATPGFVKLFAQVKIGGKDIFAPFGVMVGKAP